MYQGRMRTTLTLDDEVLRVAKSLADARDIPLGRAVSDLARKGIEWTRAAPVKTGAFPTFHVRPGARAITLEDVKRAEDEG